MASKICKGCGIEKDLDEFHSSPTNKMGRHPYCKECRNWNHRSEKSKLKELELQSLTKQGLKKCPKCQGIKPFSEFGTSKQTKSGLRGHCKDCDRKHNLEYARSEKGKRVQAEYELTPRYFEKLHARYRKKMDTRPDFKTALYLRNQLYNGITGYGAVKETDFITMVGLNPIELNKYLESQFEEGMTWENHNRHGWHIDHIIPMNAFNMKDSIQQRASCYYKNLRPMWGKPNIQKGAKYLQEDFDNYMDWFIKNVYNK